MAPIDIGRLFHILGAATMKALLAVAVFTLACTRRFISDDLKCSWQYIICDSSWISKWGLIHFSFVCKKSDLENYAFMHWQPMQGYQRLFRRRPRWKVINDSNLSILNFLKFVTFVFRSSIEKRVAIIQSRQHNALRNYTWRFMWKTMSDVSESPDVIVAWSTHFWDMFFETKSIVDNPTKAAKGNS